MSSSPQGSIPKRRNACMMAVRLSGGQGSSRSLPRRFAALRSGTPCSSLQWAIQHVFGWKPWCCSASVHLCGSVSRSRLGSCARRMRFSAARYSFRNSTCWFISPVTYASSRAQSSVFMQTVHHRRFNTLKGFEYFYHTRTPAGLFGEFLTNALHSEAKRIKNVSS